jgi:hypothetical protein
MPPLNFKETKIKNKDNKHIIQLLITTTLPIINKRCYILINRKGIQPLDVGDSCIANILVTRDDLIKNSEDYDNIM